MNIGQVLETHLGWAAHMGFQADGGRSNTPARLASPVFDGATLEEIDDLLIRSSLENPDSPVQFKINDEGAAGPALLAARCGCTTAAPASASTTRSPSATCTS